MFVFMHVLPEVCYACPAPFQVSMEGLASGRCGGAVAAGVNVTLVPDTPAMFQRAGVRTVFSTLTHEAHCLLTHETATTPFFPRCFPCAFASSLRLPLTLPLASGFTSPG